MKSKMRSMGFVVFVALTMALLIQGVFAQREGGRRDARTDERQRPADMERRDGGDRGQRRGFDPSIMQERALTRIKETISAKDEEWKAIEPLAKNVIDAQMKVRAGGFWGRREESEGPSEIEALRKAVEAEDSKPEDIKKKLEDYRTMRKKNEEDLKKAQGELKKVLTVKQEAQMVLLGTLD